MVRFFFMVQCMNYERWKVSRLKLERHVSRPRHESSFVYLWLHWEKEVVQCVFLTRYPSKNDPMHKQRFKSMILNRTEEKALLFHTVQNRTERSTILNPSYERHARNLVKSNYLRLLSLYKTNTIQNLYLEAGTWNLIYNSFFFHKQFIDEVSTDSFLTQ